MSEPGGGGGEDGSAGLEVSAVQNVADVSVLQKHLRKLVPLLLEDGGEAPAALEAALEEKSALEQMRKFLSDPQVHTVLVERSTLKGAVRGAAPRGRVPAASRRAPGHTSCRRSPGVPLPGRGGRGGRPCLAGPATMGSLCLLGLKMAELGGDSVSRAERGRRPHPGLQCHMSFSVSICGQVGLASGGMCQGQPAEPGIAWILAFPWSGCRGRSWRVGVGGALAGGHPGSCPGRTRGSGPRNDRASAGRERASLC